jgi:tetratricopeptide (TPR) repeat protein
MELHRLIAQSMENDTMLSHEQSDISRLLTLFEHWKSCGDFQKAAPLALNVGARLEEWDLMAQSLEIYEDALELSFESVQHTDEDGGGDDEWVQVKAKPVVLDLILRLHICIGLCHQRLGDIEESTLYFEDAYNIMRSSSKIPGMSKALMMPIVSSLCAMKLDEDANDPDLRKEQDRLIQLFVSEAREIGDPVDIARALAMKGTFEARLSLFDSALACVDEILTIYKVEEHSYDMVAEYGSDFALVSYSDSVQWLYLIEKHDEAEKRADWIIDTFLPMIDLSDTDGMMAALFPILQVLVLLERAQDADWLLKKYVINPYHENAGHSELWAPLFNPLAYLLELVLMEEAEQPDEKFLHELEEWLSDDHNLRFSDEIERKAHTLVGEICWRLAYFKDDEDPQRAVLLEKAQSLLEPIARYPHREIFLKQTAIALLEAL